MSYFNCKDILNFFYYKRTQSNLSMSLLARGKVASLRQHCTFGNLVSDRGFVREGLGRGRLSQTSPTRSKGQEKSDILAYKSKKLTLNPYKFTLIFIYLYFNCNYKNKIVIFIFIILIGMFILELSIVIRWILGIYVS